jgi:1-deoxy-D-xylulose-5-phosphate synthase
MLPNMTIMAPCDATELKLMLDYAYNEINGPAAIRYPKDIAEISQLDNYHPLIKENPFMCISEGSDLLIIVVGPFVSCAKECIKDLNENKINAGLIYLRILKPIDYAGLIKEIKKYKSVLVIEENVFSGSISQEIASFIIKEENKIIFSSINLPDKYIEHDSRKNILATLGYDKNGILKASCELLKKINVLF